jgi:hypothetical protein
MTNLTNNSNNNYQSFLETLAHSESSNNYDITNSHGYLGKYQMGEAALIDTGYYIRDKTPGRNDWSGHWTGKDGISSKQDFLDNHVVQGEEF